MPRGWASSHPGLLQRRRCWGGELQIHLLRVAKFHSTPSWWSEFPWAFCLYNLNVPVENFRKLRLTSIFRNFFFIFSNVSFPLTLWLFLPLLFDFVSLLKFKDFISSVTFLLISKISWKLEESTLPHWSYISLLDVCLSHKLFSFRKIEGEISFFTITKIPKSILHLSVKAKHLYRILEWKWNNMICLNYFFFYVKAPCKLARILCPWDSPGKNIGVGCHSLPQGIFPTQGSNPGLLYHRQILYHLSYQRSP